MFLFCQSKIGKSKWSRGNVCNVFLWRGSRCQLLWRRVDRSYTKHMSLPRMIDVVGPCYATADECSQWLEQGASGSIKMDEINIGSQRRPLCFQPSIWRRGIESRDLVASSCSYRFSLFNFVSRIIHFLISKSREDSSIPIFLITSKCK